jgi:ABC-type multidrug transport system fused ATPase/permease subunit
MYARSITALIVFPSLSGLVAFGTSVGLDRTLHASDAFGALAFFHALRFPLNVAGTAISMVVQTGVALGRLQTFLGGDVATAYDARAALQRHVYRRVAEEPEDAAAAAITVRPCVMSWPSGATATAPATVSSGATETPEQRSVMGFGLRVPRVMQLRRGELVAVVGVVGGGKSTLLAGLLHEASLAPLHDGRDGGAHSGGPGDAEEPLVCIRGGVAYSGQQAWIVQATLRDNVLMGADFDEAWYDWCASVLLVNMLAQVSCSSPVLSCPLLSSPVLSCPLLSSPVLSCPLLSYPLLSSRCAAQVQSRG